MKRLPNLIGRYIYQDSPVHHLDPRTKLIAVLVLLCLTMLAKGMIPFGLLILFLVVAAFLTKLRLICYFVYLRPVVWLLFIVMVVHLFGSPSQHSLSLTIEGLVQGATFTLRLIVLILFVASFTLTTSPSEITAALEHLLKPLKHLKLPVHEAIFVLTISLCFIPTLIEECRLIIQAQTSRGVDFRKGHLISRLRKLQALLIPLFLNSFRRAHELALAMEARGYRGGEGRTSLRVLKFTKKDYLTWLTVLAFTICFLVSVQLSAISLQ